MRAMAPPERGLFFGGGGGQRGRSPPPAPARGPAKRGPRGYPGSPALAPADKPARGSRGRSGSTRRIGLFDVLRAPLGSPGSARVMVAPWGYAPDVVSS